AVSGLPPLNGFVSEWLVYLGMFDAVMSKGKSAWAAVPAVIMLAMAGAIAMASFLKAGAMIFLGAPRTQHATRAHGCGMGMRGPFTAEAVRLERIPETVLERIIGPVSIGILQLSTSVRRLQHGRLQFYILYVVSGLIGLGILVLLGGVP